MWDLKVLGLSNEIKFPFHYLPLKNAEMQEPRWSFFFYLPKKKRWFFHLTRKHRWIICFNWVSEFYNIEGNSCMLFPFFLLEANEIWVKWRDRTQQDHSFPFSTIHKRRNERTQMKKKKKSFTKKTRWKSYFSFTKKKLKFFPFHPLLCRCNICFSWFFVCIILFLWFSLPPSFF